MEKLNAFIVSANAEKLSRVSYELLCLQFATMKTYASILSKRLYYWDEKQAPNK
jgi:hypothetical protein